MDIQTIINTANPILKKYGVTKASLFGSVIRNETHAGSDIDMLIDLPKKASLYDYLNLQKDLEEALKKKLIW